MSVLMLLEGNYPPDIRVENEIKILNKEGIKVILGCLRKQGKGSREEDVSDLLKIYRLPISQIFFNLRINPFSFPIYAELWDKFVKKILSKHEINYIHVHDLPMLRVAKKNSLTKYYAVNVDLHENFPVAIQNYKWATKFPNKLLAQPNQWKNIEKKAIKHANKIIVLSEHFKQVLLKKYSHLLEEQFIIYPNVPSLELLGQEKNITPNIKNPDNWPVLTYFGRISKRRGIITAIKALKNVIIEGYKLKLLLIGPIEKREKHIFREYFFDKDISDYIEYIEWIDMEELGRYMDLTDICISPIIKNEQHESGVANKVFQYMMYGKPVVVSDCKPQAKIITEEKCGVIFKSETPGDLAEKLMFLLKQPESRFTEMGENAKKAMLKKYNAENMGKQLINLYQQ